MISIIPQRKKEFFLRKTELRTYGNPNLNLNANLNWLRVQGVQEV